MNYIKQLQKKVKEQEEQIKKLQVVNNSNPELNDKAISIIQQPDGNWIGQYQKNGKLVEVRGVGPETVLVLLLTHE